MHVLVVEDDAVLADGLSRVLGSHGMAVEVVGNGVQADQLLQRAGTAAAEVVVLDIGLPGISGYELARGLRALPATAGATMVAITGYGRREDREQARAAGFDEYFVKPVDMDALLALIAGLSFNSGAP